MFDSLFDFDKERLPLQALGFYIVFFIMGLAIAMTLGAIFAVDFVTFFAFCGFLSVSSFAFLRIVWVSLSGFLCFMFYTTILSVFIFPHHDS